MQAGDRLGTYTILAHIGAGGMGDVYLAEDARLGRRVALKVLPPDLAVDASNLARFELEARAASALNHPSILTIYELAHEDGLIFIVTEYVEGETLRDRLLRGPLPLEEVITIGTQIASALSVAHAAGIVHRDIKPDNIMVRPDGLVKILDFGLAKLLANDSQPNANRKLTVPGIAVGTVHYMSPEQARGKPVDARSDIFSLGSTLYEVYSGRAPFDGETWSHIMIGILEAEAEPLDDPDLQRILSKAMRKDPAERYHTAGEMLADLRAVQVGASQPRSSSAAVRPVSRRRAGVIAGVAVALLTTIGAIAAYVYRGEVEAAAGERVPIAVADFDNQTGEKSLDGLSGMLITSLEQSRRLSVMTRARMFDTLRRLGKPNVSRIDEQVGREVARAENLRGLVTASVTKLGNLYVIDMKMLDPVANEYVFAGKKQGKGQEEIPELIDSLSEELRLALKESSQDLQRANKQVAEATTTNLDAYQHYFIADQHIAHARMEEAEQELKKAVRLDPEFALAWARLAYAASWFDRPEARAYIDRAQRYSVRLPEKQRLEIDALAAQIGGEPAKAIVLREELLKRYPDERESLYIAGDLAFHMGDAEKARRYLRRALELRPQDERAMLHLLWNEVFAGDLAQAEVVSRQYLAQVPSPYGYAWPVYTLFQAGAHVDALEAARGAVERYPQSVDARMLYALMLYSAGDRAGMERELETLRENPEARERGRYEWTRALIARADGRYGECVALLRRSGEIAAANGFTANAADAQAMRALVLALWGRSVEAREIAASLISRPSDRSTNMFFYLYQTYITLGDFDAAEAVIRNTPHDTPVLQRIIRAARLLRSGDANGAADLLHGPSLDPYRAWYAAQCTLAAGRYDQVVESARKLGYSYPAVPWGGALREYLLGRAEEGRGNREAAKKHYRNVIEHWHAADRDVPELVDAKARLAKL